MFQEYGTWVTLQRERFLISTWHHKWERTVTPRCDINVTSSWHHNMTLCDLAVWKCHSITVTSQNEKYMTSRCSKNMVHVWLYSGRSIWYQREVTVWNTCYVILTSKHRQCVTLQYEHFMTSLWCHIFLTRLRHKDVNLWTHMDNT